MVALLAPVILSILGSHEDIVPCNEMACPSNGVDFCSSSADRCDQTEDRGHCYRPTVDTYVLVANCGIVLTLRL